jgi:hypothetical protein
MATAALCLFGNVINYYSQQGKIKNSNAPGIDVQWRRSEPVLRRYITAQVLEKNS